MGRASYYRGIQGSRELSTAPLDADARVAQAEALPPGSGGVVEYGDVALAALAPRGTCVKVPVDVFDGLALEQDPLEQAAYFQLVRLSYGDGRNFCRVGKRLLMGRLHLSERRLNRVLDGLVRKGHLRPLHRNNDGTLYRVFLPAELARTDVGPAGRLPAAGGLSPAARKLKGLP